MGVFDVYDTVGNVVTRYPQLSRLFEQIGIDYCCGGRQTLGEVFQIQSLDPKVLLSVLEDFKSINHVSVVAVAAMSLTELSDHIEQTHHAYLHSELPRLDEMTNKVAAVHGEKDPRLHHVRRTFLELFQELSSHLMKEEQILFPMIRQLDASTAAPLSHCGSLANPIGQMEWEHERAGAALERLRELTDSYTPPEWACNTYLALLDALTHLEYDLHQHIHKENNVLFPRAIALESEETA